MHPGTPAPAAPGAPDPWAHRRVLWLLALAVIAVGGVRFSDGSVLLAIARGATVRDPALAIAAAQYVWDAPLKVMLLRLLPAHVLWLGAVFGMLALLPLGLLLWRDPRNRALAALALLWTPALKISVQNAGLGDGIVICLAVAAALSRRPPLVACMLLLIGLWHPQQAWFIGGSLLVGHYCYLGGPRRRLVLAVGLGLSAAMLAFFAYRQWLGFGYQGRGAYMLSRFAELLPRNLAAAPVAFAPVFVWLVLWRTRPAGRRQARVLACWLAVLCGASLLTTDVTRVMTLISLPLLILGARHAIALRGYPSPRLLSAGALAVLLLPPFSWSGFDALLWTDLAQDLCKWRVACR